MAAEPSAQDGASQEALSAMRPYSWARLSFLLYLYIYNIYICRYIMYLYLSVSLSLSLYVSLFLFIHIICTNVYVCI